MNERAVRRFHVVTFGCKLNQYESSSAAGWLRGAGWESTASPSAAELILVNTCTVTAAADADARKAARRLRREAPLARMIASGCYAERDAAALRALGIFDAVVGHRDRDRLPALLTGDESCSTAAIETSLIDPARAFLKVQDGCDQRCSYCVIPAVRGRSRSRSCEDLVKEVQRLAAAGAKEIGLTGVNVGCWGLDLPDPARLESLLEALLKGTSQVRFRLNSLEPRTVTDELLRMMASHPDRLAPHLQIPLQSGSDRILARMSRNYRSGYYRRVLDRAKQFVPGICLGADVIVGFPGETVSDHEAGLRFIESAPLDYLHVFSYSARPGTRAAAFGDPVDPRARRERVEQLIAHGREKRRAFQRAAIGSTLTGLVLQHRDRHGRARALTENYLDLLLPEASPGSMLRVRPIRFDESDDELHGELAA